MASYLDKERINTAITDSTKFDLSHVHLTTSNFMELTPIYVKEMVPGEKINCNIETFSRMNPLPVPTFGRANIKNRAYFVPARTIFRAFNDFITDAPHTPSDNVTTYAGSLVSTVPTVTNKALLEAFIDVNYYYSGGSHTNPQGMHWDYGMDVVASGSSSIVDYTVLNADSTTTNYQLTTVGRQCMKILESLGYKVNFNMNDTTVYSALPLLSFAKIYTDWYFPSAYTNAAEYAYLQLLCNADTGNGVALNKVDVGRILQMCYICYDSDYFVSAFDNPSGPGMGKVSDFKLSNLDYVANARTTTLYDYGETGYVTNNSGTNTADNRIGGCSAPFISPYVRAATSGVLNTPISQYLLHSLHALSDYLKRHQLAGSRAFDRYLARFGKGLSAEKMNRSVYLGCQTIPIQFGDVMSNSDTEGAALGQYAGRGIAYSSDNGDFSFETDEFGFFVVVSTITPATGYYQGINRSTGVKHISKLDWFVPEMDSLGCQPQTSDELYISYDGSSPLASVDVHSHVFGFVPRYAEYKVPFDQVTGNFRYKSAAGAGLESNGSAAWHLMRTFDDDDFQVPDGNGGLVKSVDAMVHSLDFVYSRGDMTQYDRIFYYPEGGFDNFTIVHNFDIASWAPMKPLYDSYDFEDKGKKVTLEVNGVKHN